MNWILSKQQSIGDKKKNQKTNTQNKKKKKKQAELAFQGLVLAATVIIYLQIKGYFLSYL